MTRPMDKAYIRYKCYRCNYKFSMKRGSPVTVRCPYCGGENVIEDDFDLNRMLQDT
jgi:DNA-directed RNA polymerase subunit RPC12/RpoP